MQFHVSKRRAQVNQTDYEDTQHERAKERAEVRPCLPPKAPHYPWPDDLTVKDSTAMNYKTDPRSFALGLTAKLVEARTLAQSPSPAAGVGFRQ